MFWRLRDRWRGLVGESTLIARVPEATPVIDLCAARLGLPIDEDIGPHITVLYPFVPPRRLGHPVTARLEAALADCAAFSCELSAIGTFPGVTWLAPRPTSGFEALTAAVTGAFPEHPPYRGAFDSVVHHLTVAPTDHLDDKIIQEINARLPVSVAVGEVDLLERSGGKRWSVHHRFRLPAAG